MAVDTMDRLIDPARQRRRKMRRLAIPTAVTILVVAGVVLVAGWLRPSVRRDRVRTAIVF